MFKYLIKKIQSWYLRRLFFKIYFQYVKNGGSGALQKADEDYEGLLRYIFSNKYFFTFELHEKKKQQE